MKIKNFFCHLHTVNKHRFLVFKLSVKAGIPIRGLLHDLSKYSWTEFSEGVKYFQGTRSPIIACKEKMGYSKAWLHHTGINKHHFEYWYDFNTSDKTPVIPYKYTVEMICDTIAAGIVYKGKKWSAKQQIKYFTSRNDLGYINDDIKKILIDVYNQIDKNGINKTLNKKNLKKTYYKYIKK